MSRSRWKVVAIGSAVLGGIGALMLVSRRASKAAPPKRVALIGDSYAAGLGPELEKLIPEFKFSGVVGTNTSQWARHSAACGTCGDWLTTYKPDTVLVSLGVNDGATPNPANYQTIVRGLQSLGARVVWIEPPAAVNAPAVRATITSLGVNTIPAPSLPMANSLHPASYSSWARDIATAIGKGV